MTHLLVGASAFVAPRWVEQLASNTSPRQARLTVTSMGRKFENNKVKMAKTAAAYTKKAAYFGKRIAQCVSEKGPDPESNRELGLLMREAKSAGVRSDVVERNIKKASEKGTSYKELTYEAYGVGGVGLIINCLSDSNNRATAEVNACVKKLGEKLSPSFKVGSSGSVLFNFERKGRLTLASEMDEDRLIEVAIEAGVDDADLGEVDEVADGEEVKAVVLTAPGDLGALQAALLAAGVECAGGFVNVPLATVDLSPEDLEMNLQAIDKLEEIDDVDRVEHNIRLA